jgi:ABC-2 type transport system permease protein
MVSERTGEVYDLGYQRYAGPREGRTRARKAMYLDGVKLVLGIGRGARAKKLPLLLFASAMVPAMIFVIILSVVGPADDFIPGPADYNGVIGTLLIMAGAIMAPELLTPDRKDRVLDLYLVRPISSDDYVFARVAAFFSVIFALVCSGQIVLQIGLLLTATDPWEYLKDNWLDIPRFLGAGFLVALFVTVIPMAVASFTTRRAYASAFVIGYFLITLAVINALTAQQCDSRAFSEDGQLTFQTTDCRPLTGDAARYIALASPMDISFRVNDIVFGLESQPDDAPSVVEMQKLPTGVVVAFYLAYVLVPLWLIRRQYKRLRP